MHAGLNVRWSRQGWKVSPCCFINTTNNVDVSKKHWFQDLWPKLRHDNINNEPLDKDFCKPCIQDEICNKQSKRLGEIIKRGKKIQEKPKGPKHLEITLDYSCNQACMICGPSCSSLWKKYTQDKGKFTENYPIAKKSDIEKLLQNIDIKNIDTIKILGGEPLLAESHLQLLEILNEKKCDLSKIELWYHSNGSCKVGKNVLELWKKFKLVLLYFSIDDIGEAFEYQRYPGNWKNLIENINWFKNTVSSNVLLRIERTISLLNAHRILKLDKWKIKNYDSTKFNCKIELNSHMCQGSIFQIENISKKHLNFLKTDKKNYEALLKIYPMNKLIVNEEIEIQTKVMKFVSNQDQKRSISINSYFPEFNSLYQ